MNKENGFTEYRYYKPMSHYAPKIAFKFDVTYADTKDEVSSVKFSYAICSEQDNFSRKVARDILDKRMIDGQILVGEFKGKGKTLVSTAMGIVDDLIENFESDSGFNNIIKSNKKSLIKFNNIKMIRTSYDWINRLKEIEKFFVKL
jgi:hypothetical protein